MNLLEELPHRRYNLLTDEWVLVSPHRTKRPWKGKMESRAPEKKADYDKNCYLCPGNLRASQERNPDYDSVFVFENDFSALKKTDEKQCFSDKNGLLRSELVSGECRVMCFSPKHNLTLPLMDTSGIFDVVREWAFQTEELGKQYRYVQIFENKGDTMGCSNPHPHCQIWAGDFLPNQVKREFSVQKSYFEKNGKDLIQEYCRLEAESGVRTVVENTSWIAVVPYWAVWPYEILLMPKRYLKSLVDLTEPEIRELASLMKELLIRYDNLFEVSFPYSMGWHQSLKSEDRNCLHAHFYPPLLRSAEIKKFMVGYEMLAEAQRDLLPETAAETLRNLPSTHYSLA